MERLLSKAEVLEIVGVTFPTLWLWMRENRFPRSIVLQPDQKFSRVAWREQDIQEWCDQRPTRILKGDAKRRRKAAQ